ncbi:Acetylajmalan esterase [Acorus calamus]|uniref:Acetylajmalan esterase n=1 Tax=Acorus calamus TaxID=4465 RepID=A0AAV9C6K8_ACOCL|nr:Acetylajmalan esterase [Acorus calamus]
MAHIKQVEPQMAHIKQVSSPLLFAPATGACSIDKIYNFGDSISDTGNLIRQGTGSTFDPITRLPYGQTYFHKATGRCSDGLLMIDYLAMSLGLPFLNPYLDEHAPVRHGLNFAVAGATALDKSFFTKKNINIPYTNSSLNVQLNWFNNHLNNMCSTEQECDDYLKNALFMVGEIGGNDYNYALFGGKSIDEVKTYVPQVVDAIIGAAKTLIDNGAKQLVVPGNFPIGCMPNYLTTFHTANDCAYDNNKCLKDFNNFAEFHNFQLQEALNDLRNQYPLIKIMYADYYNAFTRLLSRAPHQGFDKNSMLKSCCGTGGEYNYKIGETCGMSDVQACSAPEKMISWDGIHLTQAAYKALTEELIVGGATTLTMKISGRSGLAKICHSYIITDAEN